MIDLEQLRKDMEAGTQGDWIVDATGDTHYIARVPQLEREYIALREAADALADLVSDSTETQTEFATEWDVAASEATK